MILGVDPSMRHTGLCLLVEAGPIFHEIKPTHQDILSCQRQLRQELIEYTLSQLPTDETLDAIAIERQLPSARSSALLFNAMMAIVDVLTGPTTSLYGPTPKLLFPLPVQLRTYLKEKQAFPGGSDALLVEHFKKQTGRTQRTSIHCVDAYYLARLGEDVLKGAWRYNLPAKEIPLTPWKVTNGD